MQRIVVAGASAAGLSAVQTLREQGFDGELVLVDGERHAGYDRPPLSKQALATAVDAASLALREPAFYAEHRIDHRRDVRATALDLQARTVALDSGDELAFDGLIIATGLRARLLPGLPAVPGVHTLRTLDDAVTLRAQLRPGARLVVIGAGFLGGEVAATARALGLDVALVDPLPQPMARQLGPLLAAAVMDLHRAQGVRVLAGRTVSQFETRDGRLGGVHLDDGTHLPCDVVLVAIGSLPNTEWLQGSGLVVDDGVVCDEFCGAAPGVHAAGDVARWKLPRSGRLTRLEHRQNATEQGIAAARNLLGAREPYDPLPYFWTDLHGTRIQVFGHIGEADRLLPQAGVPGRPGFAALASDGQRVTAAIGWGAPRPVRRLSALVGQPVDEAVSSLVPTP
jgi:3-phenylpropionate/trans-cinnamate dioxygenase ferredoxin reductase subunit